MNSLLYIKKLENSTVLGEGVKSEIFKFIQRICYDGKETESLTDLKVRLHRKIKTKSSQNMPANKYSLEQHILRSHYQTWIWMHVNVKIIPDVDLQQYGWTKMVREELSETYVTPLWCKSFHRSLCIRLVKKLGLLGLLMFWRKVTFGAVTKYETLNLRGKYLT